MNKILNQIYNDTEFIEIIYDLIDNKTVQKMKEFKQHYETTCFDHCLMASYYCYKICKKLNLNYISSARAAMLHDLFLYDWRKRETNRKGLHAFTHGKCAYRNASKLFDLNKIEKDMIEKHMWPVTIVFPKYKETYILTLVDKYCALNESFSEIASRFYKKKTFRFAYVFLSLFAIKI